MQHPTQLAELAQESFVRERINPRPGDPYYLHLSDLLLALRRHSTPERIKVLDFGCGGSPYRSLFPNAEFYRADLRGAQGVDYEINESGVTNAPSESFDLVLSTQVLEHCPSPETYIRECRRTLKRRGKLLLSTHGLFEEHACPLDLYRWTEDGLRTVLTQGGFALDSIARLTMGPRAGFQLLQSALSGSDIRARPMLERLILWPVWRVLLARRAWDPFLDAVFSEYRVSGSRPLPGDNFYIDLLAAASPLEAPSGV